MHGLNAEISEMCVPPGSIRKSRKANDSRKGKIEFKGTLISGGVATQRRNTTNGPKTMRQNQLCNLGHCDPMWGVMTSAYLR
jgi:hypothetical protein